MFNLPPNILSKLFPQKPMTPEEKMRQAFMAFISKLMAEREQQINLGAKPQPRYQPPPMQYTGRTTGQSGESEGDSAASGF